jgi:hypothetical protein
VGFWEIDAGQIEWWGVAKDDARCALWLLWLVAGSEGEE